MSDTVRTPQQQRSIDKKKRIIEAGYELFAKKGYYSTNTAEIAKKAGVSTGIVYGYFRDKRDILVEVLDIYVEQVFRPIYESFDGLKAPLDFDGIIAHALDSVVNAHKKNEAIHEALHSLSHTDEAVRLRFVDLDADTDLIEAAHDDAMELLRYAPTLRATALIPLRLSVVDRYGDIFKEVSGG